MKTIMETAAETETVGTLDTLPLPALLVHLLDTQATGTLVLEEPSGRRSAVYFNMGAAAKAKTPASVSPEDSPGEALARQLRWVSILSPETSYRFYAKVDYLRNLAPVQAEPLAQIWECVQRSVDLVQVDRVLEGLADQPLILHPLANLRRFGLSEHDQRTLDPLRHRRGSFNDIMLRYEGDVGRLCRLMYLLDVCRCLKREGSAPPAGLPPVDPSLALTPSAVPHASTTQEDAPPEEVELSPLSVPTANPSKVEPEEEPQTVRQAAEPPRLLRDMPRGIPTPHSGIPAALAKTLTRAQPSLPAGGGARPRLRQPTRNAVQVPVIPPTLSDDFVSSAPHERPTFVEGDWRRVEALVHQCEFARALQCANNVRGGGAVSPEREAFVAYLKARIGPISTEEGELLLADCTKAVTDNPADAQYLFYRAWVLRAVGQEDAALEDFTAVVAQHPSHIDAAREVHVSRKRREASLAPQGIIERIRRSLIPSAEGRETSATGHH